MNSEIGSNSTIMSLHNGFPPIVAERKSGLEELHENGEPVGTSVLDFWCWATSDLLSNATRGVLAEYIVARVLGLDSGVRAQWDAYDLMTSTGLKVEVKSSAYLQSWYQKELSIIQFGIAPTLKWDEATNKRESERRRQADVYVFCVLTPRDQATVDPLNLKQWTFYVLPTVVLDQRVPTQKSIGLTGLKKLDAVKTDYDGLAEAILSIELPSQ